MSLKNAMPGILREYSKLEKEISTRGVRKLRITRDDVLEDKTLYLDYPNEYFKTVIAFGALNYAMRLEQAATELDRVLKPGGKIAAAVWIKQGRDFKDGVYYFARPVFYRIFSRYEIHEYKTIYQDGARYLIGFIGKKL